MVRPAHDDLRRARGHGIDRLPGIGRAAQVIVDAVESQIVVWQMPRNVEPELLVTPVRGKAVFLQQEESVDEANLRSVRQRLGHELAPVAVAGVELDVLSVVIVL